MRLAERHREPDEAHFTEGELDLEAPEELAVAELDEDAILEEELDNEDLLEQDVDEDTLEVTLEDLVHDRDVDEVEDEDADLETVEATSAAPAAVLPAGLDGPDDADEQVASEDLEESLDLVLLERMALLDLGGAPRRPGDDEDSAEGGGVLVQMRIDANDLVDVAPCGTDEFVCRSCFLVRRRVQLFDPTGMVCHDCST